MCSTNIVISAGCPQFNDRAVDVDISGHLKLRLSRQIYLLYSAYCNRNQLVATILLVDVQKNWKYDLFRPDVHQGFRVAPFGKQGHRRRGPHNFTPPPSRSLCTTTQISIAREAWTPCFFRSVGGGRFSVSAVPWGRKELRAVVTCLNIAFRTPNVECCSTF